MTIRGTILLGLLLCTALLAGTRLAPAAVRSGVCEAIEIVTLGAGYKSGYHVFGPSGRPYAWSLVDGTMIIENVAGRRTELAKRTIGIFNCTLPQPRRRGPG